MGEEEQSRSDSESSEELETSNNGGVKGISEYEKQRLLRIRENKARLEALGLPKLSSSLLSSVKEKTKRKGKAKKDKDDEYEPSDGEEEDRVSSSSEGDEEEEDEDFQFKNSRSSRARRDSMGKGKVKSSLRKSQTKKKTPVETLARESDFIGDDEALKQALALSLGGSSEMSTAIPGGHPQTSRTDVSALDFRERKREAVGQKSDKGKKRRKSNTSRVQMTEDQAVIHFFHLDEAGKGNITLKDLRRAAGSHDFAWTDEEMADMIYCFDNDGDGKLNFDDFRKILDRCNMIEGGENTST